MADTELKSLRLTIAGKVVPIRVHPSEEAMIQGVVKALNEQINQYQIDYKLRDKMDGVVMLLLTYAIDSKRMENIKANSKVNELLSQIEEIVSA